MTVNSMTISRLAQAADVHVETVRYYQRRGLLSEPERPMGSVRRYGSDDVGRLQFIRRAQAMGFSLDEIAGLLEVKGQRACEEKRHTGAITLGGRGWDTRIAFGAGGAIHESNCDFSGACIDVCPTAALMEHPNKWVSKPDTWTTTTCDSCAIDCSSRLGTKDGRGVIVRPGDGNPVSGDQICVRGRYHYDSLKPREGGGDSKGVRQRSIPLSIELSFT